MRIFSISAILLASIIVCAGCSTSYMVDRMRDAIDPFSMTVGIGVGAKGRVGPFSAGLLFNQDYWGLRNGCRIIPNSEADDFIGMADLTCTILSMEKVGSDFVQERVSKDRGKYHEAFGAFGITWREALPGDDPPWNVCIPYYTQVEMVGGVGGSLRLGFNPGEFLDFILGWVSIDIFSDDIGIMEVEEDHENCSAR